MTHYVNEIKKYIIRACFGAKEYQSATHSVPLAIGLFGDEKEGAIASLLFNHDISRNPGDPSGSREPAGFGNGAVTCNLPVREYPRVLDLLRNEKSLFFHFDSESTYAWITASEEPAGEHEMIRSTARPGKIRKKRKIHAKNDLLSPESQRIFLPAPPAPGTMA
jgi:hypothetical protein